MLHLERTNISLPQQPGLLRLLSCCSMLWWYNNIIMWFRCFFFIPSQVPKRLSSTNCLPSSPWYGLDVYSLDLLGLSFRCFCPCLRWGVLSLTRYHLPYHISYLRAFIARSAAVWYERDSWTKDILRWKKSQQGTSSMYTLWGPSCTSLKATRLLVYTCRSIIIPVDCVNVQLWIHCRKALCFRTEVISHRRCHRFSALVGQGANVWHYLFEKPSTRSVQKHPVWRWQSLALSIGPDTSKNAL